MNSSEIIAVRPIAHIHGQPLLDMPADLYIPPDALELVLENFQGPLDLLLYLIRKHNLDVLDIPMLALTRQYLAYIELMQQSRLELAAEYLLMAAMLIEIKSRMLLPRPAAESEEEVGDPRAELMRRLLEYEQMKLAAQQLAELPQQGREFELVQVYLERTQAICLPSLCVDDLQQAWLAIMSRSKLHKQHIIKREQLSVREQMSHVLTCLQSGEFVVFEQLFETEAAIPRLVVTFIAILELAKEYLVEIQQLDLFGPIYVRLRQESEALL